MDWHAQIWRAQSGQDDMSHSDSLMTVQLDSSPLVTAADRMAAWL